MLNAQAHVAAAILLFGVASPTLAQRITARWQPIRLSRVPNTSADSATHFTTPLTLVAGPGGSVVLRYTFDNPCQVRVIIQAREDSPRTLKLGPKGKWQNPGRICPGLYVLETYVGTVSGLKAGHWRVAADALTRRPMGDLIIK